MLTPAQYKTLKAWDDRARLVFTRLTQTSNGLVLCARINQRTVILADEETTEAILALKYIKPITKKGLIYGHRKVQPACDDAIREYEEAQAKKGE